MKLTHPDWCGLGHYCSAQFGIGEHRSEPLTFPPTNAVSTAVVSIVQTPGAATPALEVRLRVRLSSRSAPGQAREAARLLEAIADALRQELTFREELPTRGIAR